MSKFALVVFCCLCLALGACAPDASSVGSVSEPIIGGAPDLTHLNVVALYRVVALDREEFDCSGVLIASRVVLTAAHCVSGPAPLFVRSYSASGEPRTTRVSYARPHRDYQGMLADDIALLLLEEELQIAPARWAESELPPSVGEQVTAVGYGRGNEAEPLGIRRAGVSQVAAVLPARFETQPSPALACPGDSGGPVFGSSDAPGAVLGIVLSADRTCTQKNIITRIDAYRESFIRPFLRELEETDRPIESPCYLDANCSTGYCWLESNGLPLCSRRCQTSADCPQEMHCGPGQERATAVCEPNRAVPGALGTACGSNDDCKEHLCARFEDSTESLCARKCLPDSDASGCPVDSACSFVPQGPAAFACKKATPSEAGGCSLPNRRTRPNGGLALAVCVVLLGLARRTGDRFPRLAYVDELLANLAIALSGAIAVQGAVLFEMPGVNGETHWLGALSAVLSPGLGLATAALLRQMRRRAWSPYDTVQVAVMAGACLGWFCTQLALSHADDHRPLPALSLSAGAR